MNKHMICSAAALAGAAAAASADIPPGLYGYDPNANGIISIDTATGAGSFYANAHGDGFSSRSLGHVPGSDLFYALDASAVDQLLTFDGSGVATVVGPLGIDGVFHALAYDTGAETLYTIDRAATKQLYTVDPITGAAAPVGAPGALAGLSPSGLAFDEVTSTLYMADQSTDSLYTVDTGTGAATLVGGFGIGNIDLNGLAFDPATGSLFMSTESPYVLYELSTADGTATEIGAIGFTITGMTFVPAPGAVALLGFTGLAAARRRR